MVEPHNTSIQNEPAPGTFPHGADVPGAGGTPAGPAVSGHGGVKFEASDADTRTVFFVGLVLAGLTVASALLLIGFYFALLWLERGSKEAELPPAAQPGTEGRLPREPRLEAIEDLRDPKDSNFQLLPRRAAGYFLSQEEQLQKGGDGRLPIQEAIRLAAGKLPAEKHDPPESFSRKTASKASSGRLETGGQ